MQQQQQVASESAAAQQVSEGSPQQQELQYEQMDQDQYDAGVDADQQEYMANGEQDYGNEMGDGGQGMQVSNALAGQRASKKRAQDDVKLLANRIALLKLEEKKVSS